MISAIIIDDEDMGRLSLREKLANYCPDTKVIGEAINGLEGIALIKDLSPEIVFLDIDMPVMGGFEMLRQLPHQDFHLIFVTAFDQFAIDAIRFAAFDYLLKPVDIDELKDSIARIRKASFGESEKKIEVLKHNLNTTSENNKLAIPTQEGLLFFNIENIIHLEADGNYTKVHFKDGGMNLASRTLKDFEEILPSSQYFRSHHSHLININSIKRYIKGDGGQIELNNGQFVSVSRRKKEDFLKKFKSL